ncbi:MAG: tetratricopeptide repeat protein [Pirellulaceae bacterium]
MHDDEAAYDAWGEPLDQLARSGTRTWGRWQLAGAICVLLVAGGGGLFLYLRQAAIESLSQSCRTALHREDWQLLDDLAARWRWWDPFKAAPLIYLAESAYQKGALERAIYLLDLLPDDDPLTPPALVEQSSILFGPLNRPIRAAEVLERAVRLDPRNAEARRRLIFFYAFTLQRRKMADHVYAAIRNDCDSPEVYVYLVARDWLSFSNAYSQNTNWVLGNPNEELFLVSQAIYRVLTKGLDYSENPTDEPAGKDGTPFHQLVIAEYFKQFPENLELLVYHLEMALTKGDADEVVRLLSRAPAAAAEDNRFWRYKGWVYAARGEFPEAEAAYEKALQLNPYDYRSQHQLAGVERSLRRFDRVEKLENLSQQGTSLRRDILVMDRVDTVPPDILKRIAEYAQSAGDTLVADKLQQRFKDWSSK